MDPHRLGVHSDTKNPRREVVGVLPPVLDVVQIAAQLDGDLLRSDADIDFGCRNSPAHTQISP
jgi:hypothetical protein